MKKDDIKTFGMTNEKIKKIVNHYGILHQIKYWYTEIFELSEAIINCTVYDESNNYNLDLNDSERNLLVDHITEEIADVSLMLLQFVFFYEIDTNNVMKVMSEKLDRQLSRIENEEGNNK